MDFNLFRFIFEVMKRKKMLRRKTRVMLYWAIAAFAFYAVCPVLVALINKL